VQLETQDRDAGRFERIAAADLFEPGSLRRSRRMKLANCWASPQPALC